MAAEHCVLGGCDHVFTSNGYYGITSTPRKEWMYIVGDEHGQCWECPEDDMKHGRRIISIDEYMRRDRVKAAGLNRAEVIALIMYSGPMVCSRVFLLFYFVQSACILFSVDDSATPFVSDNMAQFQIYNSMLRQYPMEMYEEFKEAGNRFASTLFAMVSAVVKLSRVETLKPGTKLYRGMGGSMQLPDSFYSPDMFGARGYVENGFLNCSSHSWGVSSSRATSTSTSPRRAQSSSRRMWKATPSPLLR
jgi:hypothetical protein